MAEVISNDPLPLRVSAVFVSYNQAGALRRAAAALLASQNISKDQLEIIVVDCASVDDSSHLDKEFPSLQVLRLPHHRGAARAMNIALRTVKSELVLFLSPNVEVGPTTVAALADALEADTALAAVVPLLSDASGKPVPQLRKLPSGDLSELADGSAADPAAESVPVEFPFLDALLIRKNFMRGMNNFDERFGHSWADADLAMQARRSGKKIVLYPQIRATLHAAPDPLEGDSLAALDRLSGAAAFIGKYQGTGAALGFRLKTALSALVRFDFGTLSGILSGTKLDGTQAG